MNWLGLKNGPILGSETSDKLTGLSTIPHLQRFVTTAESAWRDISGHLVGACTKSNRFPTLGMRLGQNYAVLITHTVSCAGYSGQTKEH